MGISVDIVVGSSFSYDALAVDVDVVVFVAIVNVVVFTPYRRGGGWVNKNEVVFNEVVVVVVNPLLASWVNDVVVVVAMINAAVVVVVVIVKPYTGGWVNNAVVVVF